MKKILIKDIDSIKFEKSVACIGYFDGVHLGHQKLIERAIKDAKKNNVKSSVICFEPDPINVIKNTKNKHILSYKNRLLIFEYLGIDIVYVIKFDKDFMKLSANKFINQYLNKMNLVELVCGFDFSFGHMAKGDYNLLNSKAKFACVVIPENKYKGIKISSTRVKQALIRGDFRLIKRLLGWDYLIDLKVQKCLKQGKLWLVEAKLADNNTLLPQDGKYGDVIEIKNNKVYILGKTKLDINSHIFVSFDE